MIPKKDSPTSVQGSNTNAGHKKCILSSDARLSVNSVTVDHLPGPALCHQYTVLAPKEHSFTKEKFPWTLILREQRQQAYINIFGKCNVLAGKSDKNVTQSRGISPICFSCYPMTHLAFGKAKTCSLLIHSQNSKLVYNWVSRQTFIDQMSTLLKNKVNHFDISWRTKVVIIKLCTSFML